ncbi:bifunctional serine/threonine-protein kinase/formylglycine-generating enzyme family protein [Myxococcota bacterium]|nr:bifunctional serine/threonine-protein kinase/formylglycine-generating enzyme family protein [Myxococcota bacterium]
MDKKALMEELEQLGKLHQAGVLSQAEFEAQKAGVLSQLQALRGGQVPVPPKGGGSEPDQVHGADVLATGFGGGQGQTPIPSKGDGSGFSQVHGADVLATGFGGGQGQTGLGVGRVVGKRYRLVRMLGRGGMGEVWLAEEIRLGRTFALKFLADALVGSSGALGRMRREYEVLEKLSHPHIVRVFDLDQDKDSGRWYLRMEYLEGEDLGKKIATVAQQAHRPLFGMEQMMGWLGQIVEALDYAHQQGILHRDIKPANLMLTSEPKQLKVMDFGIARVVSGTHTTEHTAMMGSMYYAAPELLRGQAATPSADIYSFGVLVYEMLTGELPVGRFALPSAVVAGLSKGVDDALDQMLLVNPKQRGESLREAWLPLRDALLGKSATVIAPPQPTPASPKIEATAPSPSNVVEPSAGERRVFRVGEADLAMRWIPAGRFLRGAGEDDQETHDREKPQHEVTITRGFWMGETPVTQSQYLAVMGKNPSHFTQAGLDAPVECVRWCDAAVFANKLSALEGLSACFVGSGEQMEGVGNKGSDYVGCKGWRLPTEAEWEYACRAGTAVPRYGELDKIAWYGENSGETTHIVGRKQANAWGLHDMLGNVWEWCYDWFGSYPTLSATELRSLRALYVDLDSYPMRAATDPTGAATGTNRVLRGGGWDDYANYVRAAYRYYDAPTNCSNDLGFRVVRSGP